MVIIVNEVKEDDWKEFLENYDEALIYHTPEWRNFLKTVFGYKPYYLFAIDENDKILGMLPLMHIKSKIFPARLSCLPFAHICGYIGSKKLKRALLQNAVKLYNNLDANYLEIRDYANGRKFKIFNTFSTYVLELSSNPEEVWRKLDKGSVRWAIRKAYKMGVKVEVAKDMNDLTEFYEMNCRTKKEIGVPCHSFKFFKELFKNLGDFAKLYIARHGGEAIGGGIMLYYKNTVIYGYGAADPKSLKLYPYNAFIWKAIEDACLGGYRYFDFGRVSYEDAGLINFKKKWGTVEKKLYYSIYPENRRFFMENRNLMHHLGAKVIRRMPMPFYKKFSDTVFKHLG
jgi:predicted N-acyltransferase